MVKKWTKEEVSFLRMGYPKMSVIALSKEINHSMNSVYCKLSKLGLNNKHKKWDKNEIVFIKKNYIKMSNIELSRELNCSPMSISNKINKLGIKRSKECVYKIKSEHLKGKSYEELYGKEKASKIRFKLSIANSGENNPRFGKKCSEETKKKMRDKKKGKIPKNLKENHKKMRGEGNPMFGRTGKLSPRYIHGLSKEPYTEEWTLYLKNLIRKRDNQICMNCGIHREKLNKALSVHHIDYNKKNCLPENLISLCEKCHSLTNINREYWKKLFQEKLYRLYGYQYINGEIVIKI